MKRIFFCVICAAALFGFSQLTFAAGSNTPSSTASPLLGKLKTVGTGAGYDGAANQGTVLQLLGTVINIALGLLGMIFIILILVAGFNWMTAAGEEEKIKKAGATIREAVIGLLIVISAFAIWSFINTMLIANDTTSMIHALPLV